MRGDIAFAFWSLALRLKLYGLAGWIFKSSWWPDLPRPEHIPVGLRPAGVQWTRDGPVQFFGRKVECCKCGVACIVSPPPDGEYQCWPCETGDATE